MCNKNIIVNPIDYQQGKRICNYVKSISYGNLVNEGT